MNTRIRSAVPHRLRAQCILCSLRRPFTSGISRVIHEDKAIERARTHVTTLSDQMIQRPVHWLSMSGFSFHALHYIKQQHLCFFCFFLFFPPSRQINSIFNRLSAQWFSWKKTGSIKSISLFKGFTLLHPVLLIYPTSFSFLRSIS